MMYALVSKSDSTVANTWNSLPTRVSKPGDSRGALCLGAPASVPFDFPDDGYVFVEVTEAGFEPFDPATQNRTGPVLTVAQDYSVTATWTVTAKSQAELDAIAAANDESELRRREVAAIFVLITLIDTLIGKGSIAAADFDAKARAAYLDLKPIADRVKGPA